MKKIYSIIVFSLVLLLGATACTELLEENIRGRHAIQTQVSEFPEGARLNLGFNVQMPVTTKAMTEVPTIDSIHVFVFSDNGVSSNGALLEVRKATLSNPHVNSNAIMDYTQTFGEDGVNGHISNGAGATVLARWNVDLMMGRGKRRIHFVANLPKDFQEPEVGTAEFSVLRSIVTEGKDVAYWQMVEVEDGILAYTYQGGETYEYVNENGIISSRNVSSVPGFKSYSSEDKSYTYERANTSGVMVTYEVGKGDYITPEGLKVLDGGGYYASLKLSQAVNLIPLVRNFARIKVLTTSSSNFRLQRAILINTPGSGYVAPFDDASNRFVPEYRNIGTASISHATIKATGYPATIPGDTLTTMLGLQALQTEIVKSDYQALTYTNPNTNISRDSVFLYMYERGIPTQKPTSLLVYGTLTGKGNKWFKIEISDENGDFFPIYRDFTYEVHIKSINADGYNTLAEAFANDAIGDISGSDETKTLTKIIDGSGLTLHVGYIDHTSTNPDNHSVPLLYKFYKGTNIYTGNVTLDIVPVTGRDPAINSTSTTLSGTPYSGANTPDGSSSGWYVVDVPLYGSSNITKVSTLHVEGKQGAKTMYRNVSYRVMAKQDLTLSNDGLDADALNEETTLNIKLPDYLGYSVFPLTLMIEAQNGNLNPADGEVLSVDNGPSLFPGGGNSYYFLKTVEYSDYQESNVVTCKFKTTQLSGNATWVAVTDKEGYFNTATDYISTGDAFLLSANSASVAANETSAKFTIISTGQNPDWTLAVTRVPEGVDEQDVQLSDESGTGSKAVTVSFPANGSNTQRTFEVTATRGDTDQTFTITQAAPEFSLSATSTSVGPDATTVSFDIISTGPAEWTVTPDNKLTDFIRTRASVEQISGTGNATITMAVPENTTSAQVTYVIKATCPDMGVTDDNAIEFTIRQDPLIFELSATEVQVNASVTTASFTVNTNSAAAWSITYENVTSAVRNGYTVDVTFPDNLDSDSPVNNRKVHVAIGSRSETFTIKQRERQLRTSPSNSITFTYKDFSSGSNVSADDGRVKVTFSSISTINTSYELIGLDQNTSYKVSFTTLPTTSILNVKIKGITMSFYSTTYNLKSISGDLSGGTSQSTSATYSNSSGSSGPLEATLVTKNSRNAYIDSIKVTYDYQYYE